MRWLLMIVVYIRTQWAISEYPCEISSEQRQRVVELIKRLADLYKMDTSLSARVDLTDDVISIIPETRGVYRFYEEDELKYVGASCTNLRKRLQQHLSAAKNVSNAPNRDLAELIASGQARVEWYASPFAGWMEDYELNEFYEKYDQPPPFNSKRRGGLIYRCA